MNFGLNGMDCQGTERNWEADWRADKPREECGVFGVRGSDLDVSRITYYGLYALQHRGQESAGIAVSDGDTIKLHKNMGLVPEVFKEHHLDSLTGCMAIGHVRYSTTGASLAINAQPLVFRYAKGMLAVAHNGNLTNARELRTALANTGSIFQSTIDTEVLVNLIARYCGNSIEEAIMKLMIDVKGSYSLVVMSEDKLIGVRDPYGNRPLCLGRLEEAYVIASETCALDTVGAEFIRDIEPGEIVVVDDRGITSIRAQNSKKRTCIFEYIYFARPDSVIDGYNVNWCRRQMGRQLAREYQVDVDLVLSVPDSGTAAAKGYAEERGLPFEDGLMKNRYIGRTFIQPSQSMREIAVRLKLNPIKSVVEGKRIVLVDDSIVRGTTSSKIVKMLRDAGAREIHLCISSPPVIASCYYGIDTSDPEELIACKMTHEEIEGHIGVDSLHHLSREGLLNVFGEGRPGFCTACFDNDYPIEIPADLRKHALD